MSEWNFILRDIAVMRHIGLFLCYQYTTHTAESVEIENGVVGVKKLFQLSSIAVSGEVVKYMLPR